MSLLNIFGKNGKRENENKNKDDIEITVTYNLNEIIGAHESKDREEVAKTNKIEKREKSEAPFINVTIIKEPIKKTIFVFDEAFDSKEGDLIKKIVRKQKGISFFSISKKESFEIMSKLYKNEGEDLIIIKGNYKNIASDIEIENFLEKILDKYNKKSKILRRSLSLENCKNENKDYRWMIRNYLKKLNIEAGLNIRVKEGLEKKVEEKIGEEYSKNKCDKKIMDIPKPLEMSDFVNEILEEENSIEIMFKPHIEKGSEENEKKNEGKKIRQSQEKPFEGFMTDEEMGFKRIASTIQIHEQHKSKISLTQQQLINAVRLIPHVWKGLFPWCEIEVNDKDSIRVGGSTDTLEDVISINIKENGNYTGDMIKINQKFLIYLRNGKDYFATPTEKALPLVINVAKNYYIDEENVAHYANPIIQEVSEIFTKKKATSIEQIVNEKGRDAPDFKREPGVVVCDFSDMFVKDITAEIEKIAEEKGSLAGLPATNEYKAPDSTNAGEIYLKKEDPRFTEVFSKYPKLDGLKGIATGPLFINAIVEAYHSDVDTKIKKLDEASLLVKTLPKEYQNIAYSILLDMKNKQNVQPNSK